MGTFSLPIDMLFRTAWRALSASSSGGDQHHKLPMRRQSCGASGVSDWGANAILRFDPKTETFESVPLPDSYASVRQLAGRKGEVWGAESAADKLFIIRSE
jgi:virginiamycin B lyase